LTGGLASLLLGRKQIDADLLEELEMQLLSADVGVEATDRLLADLSGRLKRKQLDDPEALFVALREDMQAMLAPVEQPLDVSAHKPFVILMVGVNGAGKTTTIGKLAKRLLNDGRSVMLAAGDTFRAAAVEQLQVWGERNGVPVVAQHTGADSASVVFDAYESARARGFDVLIADTAGRLHTQSNLMEELRKIKRVLGKIDASAPHEVMLVVDAGTGQNAMNQAEQFNAAVGLTGITLSKLDGTAKGGVIFAIAERLGVPIRFIGVGEAVEDLRPFSAEEFVDALFNE
ncbi:MAG: signal recognition particle-docking protein FtsY, partial [Chromatiales bacterium]|nr:signal recognition particle-docking protein FtsY [Chromatiales bacterium]